MTSSPFLTEKGARSPVSSRRPSPTDKTLPRLGFSLAVSGRTIPDLVLDSASRRFTRILSPRGRSFGMTLTPMKERTQNSEFRTQIKTNSNSTFGRPAVLMKPPQQPRQGIQQQIEIHRLAEHRKHVHAQR